MASEFYNKAYADERKDWRENPMTKLAIKMLNEFREEAERELFNSGGEPGEKLKWRIGQRMGIQECIELLERE